MLASFHRMLEDQRVAFDALRRPTPSVEAFDPFKRSIVRSEPSRFELQDLSFRRMLEDQRLAFDEIRPRAMSVAEYSGKVTPESQAMMSR